MTMFDILGPVYKKYKENKKKKMEKELESKQFSENIDNSLLLSKEISENALDVKESKSVKKRFTEQFMLELKKVDFFLIQI
jgi:GTP-sensing pleiotropic transcriptional regulator CodY